MDLSVIITSYNTKVLTLNSIKSVVKHTKGISFEVIVVDNASKDGSVKALKSYKNSNSKVDIKILRNSKNMGFANANNQGLRKSKGTYQLLLNSDTLVGNNVLGEMVGWLNRNKKVGVATCKLVYEDGRVQGNGGYFPTLSRVTWWMLFLEDIPFVDRFVKPFHPLHEKSFFYKGQGFYSHKKEIDWVTGAFLMVRRGLSKKVKYIDTDYFMYTEDVDFCYKIKKLGFRVMYLPRWEIIHYGGKSSVSEYPLLSEFEGIKIFYSKHMPDWQHVVLRALLKLGSFLRMVVLGILKGSKYTKIYAKAFCQA